MLSVAWIAACLIASSTTTSTGAAAVEEDVIEIPPPPKLSATATAGAIVTEPIAPEEESSIPTTSGPRARASIHLETRLAVDTSFDQKGEHVAELGFGGRLELDVELAKNLSAYAAPSFYYIAALSREGDDRETLFVVTPEARVTWSFGPFDLRAGALIFNWGASDLIGPNDVLNPLDYRRNFVAAIDDLKIPVLAAELVTVAGPVTVRAVIEPFFTPSRFFVTGWDTALIQPSLMSGLDLSTLQNLLGKDTFDALGDQLLINERPSMRPDDATLALRSTITLGDLDLSATAVHGWEPLPQVEVNPDLVILTTEVADAITRHRDIMPDFDALTRLQTAVKKGESVFHGTYHRRDLIGFDAMYTLDPFVFKIDTAYSFARTAYTQDYRPVTNPWLNTVVGFEYASGDVLQLLVEAFNITIFDVPSNIRLAFFEPRAAPPSTTTAEGRRTLAIPGVAAVIRYSILDGDVRFELAGVSTLTRNDLLLMPTIRIEIDDAQELSIGGTDIEGRDDGYGGAYSHNDEVFVQYAWTH